MARILVFTSPAAGHLFPLVPGLLALQRRGHAVHVRIGERLLATAREAGLDAFASDPAVDAVEVADYTATKDVDKLRKAVHDLLARGPLEKADLERAIAGHDPDLIITDTNSYGAGVAARASGRPWAVAIPSLLPLPGKGIPPYGLALAPRPGLVGAVRDKLLWKLVERQYAKAMLPRLSERARALARLGEPGDPWVLVTTSTDYQADEELARVAVEALRDEPVRVLLTLADAYDNAQLPSAGNVRVERFVPHGPVLARAAAVVSHSGMGIVQKAIAAGIPIAAVPFGRDQPEVARRVVEAGAGVQLRVKDLTAERLRATVREALAMRPAAQAAGARLRASGGGERFADAAEELVAEPALAAAAA